MGKLELHTGEVHIWKLRWRELETFWEWHKPLLEKEEYQKVKHYHFYEDQMRYLTGKIAVRMLLKGNCTGKRRLDKRKSHLTFRILENGY